MPPKRNIAELRAIAEGPVEGWLKTPIAKGLERGILNAPYLAVFFKYNRMPITREAVNKDNGTRLWENIKTSIPSQFYDGSNLSKEGVLPLAKCFNHGMKASKETATQMLAFLDVAGFPEATKAFGEYYSKCEEFKTPLDQLASPPTHLDFFKDQRIYKIWKTAPFEMVTLSANDLVRQWPELMPLGWDPKNCARDVSAIWTLAAATVEELHSSIDIEGLSITR
jgi:hypothetical protein